MKKPALGLFLVVIGVFLLLQNFRWIPSLPSYLFTWPMILIAIGVVQLLSGKPKNALIFVLIGGFFLLDIHHWVDFRLLWPLILVLIGLSFLIRRHKSKEAITTAEFDEVCILAGTNKKVSSDSLKGGKITTIFGGTALDFRDATLGEGATVDVFTLFGGCELRVPADWDVQLDVTAILGGVADERKETKTGGPKLILKGTVLFGGVEVKS
jgi:predicted membrane protein